MNNLTYKKVTPTDPALPPVYVTYFASKKTWVLADDYKIVLRVPNNPAGNQVTFHIPAQFEFDLASVPRIIWPLIASFELSVVAPLIHDYLYRFEGASIHHYLFEGREFPVTRLEADTIFHDLMVREGVTRWKAESAFRAVRWFAPRW